jgi:hypothetical protein
MYTQVASKLVLEAEDAAVQYSQAVSMNGGNAIFVEVTVFNQGSTDVVEVMPEVGNDLQNWQDTSSVPITGVDYKTKQLTGIAAQYVRLKYLRGESPSQKAVVAAGINVANL